MHHIIAYINIFPLVLTNLASHLTLMMTSAQVVEMSVTITDNNLSPLGLLSPGQSDYMVIYCVWQLPPSFLDLFLLTF